MATVKPVITVITPCLGLTPAAAATIASVATQRFDGLDHVVIGDSAAIRSQLPTDFDAAAIRWIDSPAMTTVALINEGLARARGDVVTWLLPGDLHFDDTLAIVGETFAADPQLGLLYGDALEIDAAGKPRRALNAKSFRRSRLDRLCLFSQPTVFIGRDTFVQVGGLDEQASACADVDLWLRLAAAGARFGYVPRLLAAERHASASSQPFRRSRCDESAVAEQCVEILGRHCSKVSRSQAARLGLIRVLQTRPTPSSFVPLWAATYRQARAVAAQWNASRLPTPWEPIFLAHRAAQIVVRHGRSSGDDASSTARPSLRPKRFQMLRRRIHGRAHHAPRPLAIPATYAQERPPHDPPVISIVTPSFNQAAFLEATLRSVLDQNYPRLEYIVQDGGSTDGSVDILRRYDSRLTAWDSRPDRGQAHAINLGVQRTTGNIMAYLNSDDLLLPGSLAYVARFFAAHPDVEVVYGNRVLIDDHGREIGRWVLPPHDNEAIKYIDFIPQETMFWRRRAWDAVGGHFDESFRFALDWDIILRFRQAGQRFVRLPRFMGAFRLSEVQKTNKWWLPFGRRETERLMARGLGAAPAHETVRRTIKNYMRRHLLYDKLYLLGLLRY